MHITKPHYSDEEAIAFLADCDKQFDLRIAKAVTYIQQSGVRFICLSGPSCAGKTTTALKITRELEQQGIHTHVISLDNFFFNMDYLIRMSEQKGTGLDMDSVDTIDLSTFEKCLGELVDQNQTQLPIFDFYTHSRSGYSDFKCSPKDMIILEGIQAIYPEITSLVKPFGMISIFVCPDQAIRVGEQVFEPNIFRFYRRIVRDSQYRGASPDRTLEIWRGVRDNEDAHIFPYREGCDIIIDSTMAYDLHLLTPYLRLLMPMVDEQSRYYLRALDILNRTAAIDPIPAKYLQEDSLYREFIQF